MNTAFLTESHDHEDCIASACRRAATLCAQRGVRFTPVRREVLEIVWASHTPVVAYEILDRLRARVKRRVAPPTVYRALDFLLDQHFIHRIESLNAYIGCPQPDARHSGQFLICDDCGEALELDDTAIGNAVMRRARATGFRVERQTIEIHGCCPNCERRTDCG